MATGNNTELYTVPMLNKGFELLELMTRYPDGISMLDLMQISDLSKSTVYRILGSLQYMGYITKNETTSRYSLTKKLLSMGLRALGEENLVELSLPIMQALRDEIKESVMLGVLINNKVVLLEQVIGSHNFTFLLRSGLKFNLHSSAPGKIFLAYSKEGFIRNNLLKSVNYEVFNERTISSQEQMLEEISKINEQGYALDVEEEMDGIHCVATPIFNQFGMVVATLWTSGPSGRLKISDFPSVAEKLKEASSKISLKLGFVND